MKTIDNKRRGNSRFFGSESYSGKKIPWPEMAVPVRVRPGLQIEILKCGIRMDFAVSTCLID